MSPLLQQLIDALKCLPGVGPKSAQRMAFYLLERDTDGAKKLSAALTEAVEKIGHCSMCRRWNGLRNKQGNFLINEKPPSPKFFHDTIRTQIKNQKGGMILWTKDDWNPGMFASIASFVAEGVESGAEREITISTKMHYTNWSNSPEVFNKPDIEDNIKSKLISRYELNYETDGAISSKGQKWLTDIGRLKPVRILWHSKTLQPWGMPNKPLDIKTFEYIYR